ncbi:MAG: GNAT family N-acetyltransferase [Fimbriimonadales bacterium]
MTEIRTIRQDECEQYLSVLCDAFALDQGRARTAFFGEPYFALDRKWALFDGPQIKSILSVVPVEFGDGKGIGIAGVATVDEVRQKGLATDLLLFVVKHYSDNNAPKALLFARDSALYERAGFSELDKVYVQPLALGRPSQPSNLDKEAVMRFYTDWSAADSRRLRRDEARWAYWSWTFRSPIALNGGYFCYESGRLREMLPTYSRLPVAEPTDFYGTGAIAKEIGVELNNPTVDLLLMGKGFDYVPQMFMTDQF